MAVGSIAVRRGRFLESRVAEVTTVLPDAVVGVMAAISKDHRLHSGQKGEAFCGDDELHGVELRQSVERLDAVER